MQRALGALAAFLAFAAGLLAGPLATGRVDPLVWCWPGIALVAILGLARRPDRPAEWALRAGLALAPPFAFMALAASRLPVTHGLALILAIAGPCVVGALFPRRIWPLLAACGVAALAPMLAMWVEERPPARGAPVAVLSGPPLFGAEVPPAQGERRAPTQEGVRAQAPFWTALSRGLPLRPLDSLDAADLGRYRALLLVQPRLLQPAELVALDGWVRRGGAAVILADPLLLWPDARPLGHPRRAPLTSLLDPLLAHWGLALEPARLEEGGHPAVERRLLAGGWLLRTAGASRFTILSGEACRLAENGLIAACAIGQGRATLIADADVIAPDLWTRDPDRPETRAAWTSDAVPFIESRLVGGDRRPDSEYAWLIDAKHMISGLCAALASLALLLAAAWRGRRSTARSHVPASEGEGADGS